MKDRIKFQGKARQLIEKLRAGGFAFNAMKAITERKFKITRMLNNDNVLGYCVSPELKNKTGLLLEFTSNTLILSEINNFDEETFDYKSSDRLFLFVIKDVYHKEIKEVILEVGNIYAKYFYTKEEVKFIITNIKNKTGDCLKIKHQKEMNKIFDVLSSGLPLRQYYDLDSTIRFIFGACIFSIEVNYVKETNEYRVMFMLYKKGCRKYSDVFKFIDEIYYISKWKHLSDLNSIINIEHLTYNTAQQYVKSFNNLKTIEKL